MQHVWTSLLDQLFTEQIDDIDATGDTMKHALTRAGRIFETVRGFVTDAERKGHQVQAVSEFEHAVRETLRVMADLEQKWPSVDPRLVEESLAAYKRGDYRTIEDLLHE